MSGLAVDGHVYDSTHPFVETCSSTRTEGPVWWQLDFDGEVTIEQVVIYASVPVYKEFTRNIII